MYLDSKKIIKNIDNFVDNILINLAIYILPY